MIEKPVSRQAATPASAAAERHHRLPRPRLHDDERVAARTRPPARQSRRRGSRRAARYRPARPARPARNAIACPGRSRGAASRCDRGAPPARASVTAPTGRLMKKFARPSSGRRQDAAGTGPAAIRPRHRNPTRRPPAPRGGSSTPAGPAKATRATSPPPRTPGQPGRRSEPIAGHEPHPADAAIDTARPPSTGARRPVRYRPAEISSAANRTYSRPAPIAGRPSPLQGVPDRRQRHVTAVASRQIMKNPRSAAARVSPRRDGVPGSGAEHAVPFTSASVMPRACGGPRGATGHPARCGGASPGGE